MDNYIVKVQPKSSISKKLPLKNGIPSKSFSEVEKGEAGRKV